MRIQFSISPHNLPHFVAAALTLLLAVPAVRAQVILAPATPAIGSSNTFSAEPLQAHPSTHSCRVTLFQNLEFADFNTKNFTYTPPAGCKGPWSKVVFTADFTVTEGTQYDRTAQFYLGGANLFYGTTAEPGSSLSPYWRVQRDVTDLSSIFTTEQAGTALLGNYVGVYDGVDYNGIIYADAVLEFYTTSSEATAPAVPNQVIGIPGNAGAATLNTSSSVYTQTLTLPTNVTSAYLDVIAQSQSNDEFWYTCVPNDLSSVLESCGNTGFRETEITIDGTPAGVAPVYPWVYTGGIDPFLWAPIPGVQTLNFAPFRVNLTPFAALLSNGKTHTVGIQVYNADSYFLAAANLLLYTDPVLKQVHGAVTGNNLAAQPTPIVENNIVTDGSGDAYGSVSIASNRNYVISGVVTTWQGLVNTTVVADASYKQTQYFTIDPTAFIQDIAQTTKASSAVYTTVNGLTTRQVESFVYPFTMNIDQGYNMDGSIYETTQSSQQDLVNTALWGGSEEQYTSSLSNTVTSQDTLNFDSSGNFTGDSNSKSSQNYVTSDSLGYCYSATITSKGLKIASVTKSTSCVQ